MVAADQWVRGLCALERTRCREGGASAVEYGLLIAGVAAVIAAAVFLFGGSVLGLFQETCDSIGTATGSGPC